MRKGHGLPLEHSGPCLEPPAPEPKRAGENGKIGRQMMMVSSPAALGKGQLPVHSKELASVTIVKYRDLLWRHDVWPFMLLYILDACIIGYFASKYQW